MVVNASAPVIVVVNMAATVRRAIGRDAITGNDIVGWRWTELPAALGVTDADPDRAHMRRTQRRWPMPRRTVTEWCWWSASFAPDDVPPLLENWPAPPPLPTSTRRDQRT